MLHLNFKNFPILTTERLTLRQLNNDDAAQLHILRSDPQVNAFINRANSTGIPEAQAFINKIAAIIANDQGMYWAIALKENSSLIGTICFWNFDIENEVIEIGYELLPAFQRKGIMMEAVKKVIEYGFGEMQAKVITALPSVDNVSSITLLEKSGFSIDGNVYNNSNEDIDGMLVYVLKKHDH